LEESPSLGAMGNVEKLTGTKNQFKLKKDDFRVIMEKDKNDVMTILYIADRKEAYKKKNRH
jgi:mRNA-degrading endonuclease RelE of RelBE toxin-antitoxin system